MYIYIFLASKLQVRVICDHSTLHMEPPVGDLYYYSRKNNTSTVLHTGVQHAHMKIYKKGSC